MTPASFSSFKLCSVEFANRIGVSPMCQYSSRGGFANDWHLVHLGSRAQGGAGLVGMEAAALGEAVSWPKQHLRAAPPDSPAREGLARTEVIAA